MVPETKRNTKANLLFAQLYNSILCLKLEKVSTERVNKFSTSTRRTELMPKIRPLNAGSPGLILLNLSLLIWEQFLLQRNYWRLQTHKKINHITTGPLCKELGDNEHFISLSKTLFPFNHCYRQGELKINVVLVLMKEIDPLHFIMSQHYSEPFKPFGGTCNISNGFSDSRERKNPAVSSYWKHIIVIKQHCTIAC